MTAASARLTTVMLRPPVSRSTISTTRQYDAAAQSTLAVTETKWSWFSQRRRTSAATKINVALPTAGARIGSAYVRTANDTSRAQTTIDTTRPTAMLAVMASATPLT